MAVPTQITSASHLPPDQGPEGVICQRHLTPLNQGGLYEITAHISRLVRDILQVAQNGEQIEFTVFCNRITIVNGAHTHALTRNNQANNWSITTDQNAPTPVDATHHREIDQLADQIIRKVYNAYLQCPREPHGEAADGSGARGTQGVWNMGGNTYNNYGCCCGGHGCCARRGAAAHPPGDAPSSSSRRDDSRYLRSRIEGLQKRGALNKSQLNVQSRRLNHQALDLEQLRQENDQLYAQIAAHEAVAERTARFLAQSNTALEQVIQGTPLDAAALQ